MPARRRPNPVPEHLRPSRYFGTLPPDRRYVVPKNSPHHIEELALKLNPRVYMIPSGIRPPKSTSELVSELETCGWIHLKRFSKGTARQEVNLTPLGRAVFTVNRYLLLKKSILYLPIELVERLARYHTISLILDQDFDPRSKKFDHSDRLSKSAIITTLQKQANWEVVKSHLLQDVGPNVKVPPLLESYLDYLKQRADLASFCIIRLTEGKEWAYLKALRASNRLTFQVP